MKNFVITVIFLAASLCQSLGAVEIKDEVLKYDVMYKWGLINKKAGEVTVKTVNKPDDSFSAMLVGHSAKWADRFYSVRDTLMGTIVKDDRMYPVRYEKISHEGGDFKRDVITYKRDASTVTATCDRYQRKKREEQVTYSRRMLSAEGYTLDMLSAFYYMRSLDYGSMKPGDSVTMNIFSGKRKEILRISYCGIESVKTDGVDHDCYKITFSFTSDGKKKSSDDLQAWISVDNNRIPYKLQGKLPVGSIKCFYVP